ncbi:hypothetical protein [Gilvimarinus chinensis]|uniref:hypothetical protein n=1 Tax=Gilvimarinus chinensis TaxID=396005 RepID=UPI0003660C27|nr:hypothetical protein [Gilvimarinus chinensis]
MAAYHLITIAFALNKSADGAPLFIRALTLATPESIQVLQLKGHPLPEDDELDRAPSENENELSASARRELQGLTQKHAIPAENGTVRFGEPTPEFRNFCRKTNSGLFIISNREQHSLSGLWKTQASMFVKDAALDIFAGRSSN